MLKVKPEISIIVPAYNAEKYLPNFLESVDNLLFQNYEIIFVDDGSKDKTFNLLKKYCLQNKRAAIFHISNHGEVFARNLGISKAKGIYLYFADADDVLHPDIFNTLLDGIKETNSDIAVCSWWPLFGTKHKSIKFHNHKKIKKWKVLKGTNDILRYYLSRSAVLGFTWRKLFKHSLLKSLKTYPKIYPENVSFTHDSIVTFDSFTKAKRICVTSKKRYYYRVNTSNTTHHINLKRALSISSTVDCLCNFDWSKHKNLYKHAQTAISWFAALFLRKAMRANFNDKKVLDKYYRIYKNGLKYYFRCRVHPFYMHIWAPLSIFKTRRMMKAINKHKK